jgi:hypothetical protein
MNMEGYFTIHMDSIRLWICKNIWYQKIIVWFWHRINSVAVTPLKIRLDNIEKGSVYGKASAYKENHWHTPVFRAEFEPAIAVFDSSVSGKYLIGWNYF